MTQQKKNKILVIGIIAAIIIGILAYVGHAYINDYYHAGKMASEAMISDNEVTVNKINDYLIAFEPKEIKAGFIFYPGGKVEFTAYAPLMHELAKNGILCILPHMPGNLAIFNINAADDLKDYYPDVTDWYIGGHSLGGSMAATYISHHTDEYKGLILLAAYSTKDLSSTDLNCISIYGSDDKVLSLEKYKKNKNNLPAAVKEFVIDGGCHSYFGNYGMQSKDGTPQISNKEQILSTVDFIINSIEN